MFTSISLLLSSLFLTSLSFHYFSLIDLTTLYFSSICTYFYLHISFSLTILSLSLFFLLSHILSDLFHYFVLFCLTTLFLLSYFFHVSDCCFFLFTFFLLSRYSFSFISLTTLFVIPFTVISLSLFTFFIISLSPLQILSYLFYYSFPLISSYSNLSISLN